SRLVPPGDRPEGLLAALGRGREAWPVYALAAAFSLLQLAPYAFPGDRALTGQGRLYALHMFDARAACAGWADLHNADGTTTRRDLKLPLDTRIACDPIVFFNRARNLCRQRDAGRLAFEDLDLFLSARRSSDAELKRVIDTKSFCAKGERYDPFRRNPWTRRGGGSGRDGAPPARRSGGGAEHELSVQRAQDLVDTRAGPDPEERRLLQLGEIAVPPLLRLFLALARPDG